MLFRFQRGSLEDSMKTVVEVDSIEKLTAILREAGYPLGLIRLYPYGYDLRIQWNTHVVTIDGMAVGFTNGALS